MNSNEGDAAAGQRWDPDRYARNGRFVADLGAPLLELLAPQPHEVILDLGCGDGALTATLVPHCKTVIGLDSSAEQVAAARRHGLDVLIGDGHELRFDEEFDGILSNAALHWMTRSHSVIDGMWRALRPGGRIAAEMGGHGNVALISAAVIAAMASHGIDAVPMLPWYFPTPEDYRARLTARGFEVAMIELINRPTTLPGDIGDWLETFVEPILLTLDAPDRPKVVEQVRRSLRADLYKPGTGWVADYVRLRFKAIKPAGAGP